MDQDQSTTFFSSYSQISRKIYASCCFRRHLFDLQRPIFVHERPPLQCRIILSHANDQFLKKPKIEKIEYLAKFTKKREPIKFPQSAQHDKQEKYLIFSAKNLNLHSEHFLV